MRASNSPPPSSDPLLVRAARGERVERVPCWFMRQAGRFMASYRELASRHPSFRERSETESLISEISLQPWRAFGMDGVIFFSDILTPLPAMGMEFVVDEARGPIVADTVREQGDVPRLLGPIRLDKVRFALEALADIRSKIEHESKQGGQEAEAEEGAGTPGATGAPAPPPSFSSLSEGAPALPPSPSAPALIGFIGSPFTLATYAIEGATSSTLARTKRMAAEDPATLAATLEALAEGLAAYAAAQVEAGAQYLVVFDSWGGKLTPSQWDVWSGPYLARVMDRTRETLLARGYDAAWRGLGAGGGDASAPRLPPIAVYALGTGGLLERLARTGADVVGVDQATDLDDARRRVDAVRPGVVLQGNLDPAALLAGNRAIDLAADEALRKGFFRATQDQPDAPLAGRILNVGHGLIPTTPEDAVRRLVRICKAGGAAAAQQDA